MITLFVSLDDDGGGYFNGSNFSTSTYNFTFDTSNGNTSVIIIKLN